MASVVSTSPVAAPSAARPSSLPAPLPPFRFAGTAAAAAWAVSPAPLGSPGTEEENDGKNGSKMVQNLGKSHGKMV